MTEIITIDDLANPGYSDKAEAILAQRETMDIEYSIEGICAYAEKLLDVPLFRGGEGTGSNYLDNLSRFVEESKKDDRLSVAGQKHLARRFVDIVIQRSRMESVFERHPEINDEVIEPPVFIAGLPRSGTTNLSGLIGTDKRLNSVVLWQAMFPYSHIEAEKNPDYVDPLIAEFQEFLGQLVEISPLNAVMKNVGYDGVDEDLCILHLAGTPMGFQNWAYTPEWNKWLWGEYDGREMYTVLKRTLQYLQWKTGDRRRWFLKNPHHLGFLATMDEVFEKPSYILTHRDPASSTLSNAYMIAYLFRETFANPDPQEGLAVAHDMSRGMIGGLVRDIDSIDPDRIAHVYFHNYMDDVWGMLREVYHYLNMEWTEELEAGLKHFMDTHKRGGGDGRRLKYLPERDFNQTRAQLREPYQFYLDRFPDVKVEEKHG